MLHEITTKTQETQFKNGKSSFYFFRHMANVSSLVDLAFLEHTKKEFLSTGHIGRDTCLRCPTKAAPEDSRRLALRLSAGAADGVPATNP